MNPATLLKRKLPPDIFQRLQQLSSLAQELSLQPYLVGGVVRDLYLSVPFRQDLDVTVTGGGVEPLARALGKAWTAEVSFHHRFLTFSLQPKRGAGLDLVTARQETYAAPAALPVVASGTLETDLKRRDFSINAMALSLSQSDWGRLEDPLNGAADLEAQKLRVLHDKSFEDDPTRIFRAGRFSGRLGFLLEEKTDALLRDAVRAGLVEKLSCDRIRVELEKILMEKNPSPALLLLRGWGVLDSLFSRVRWNLNIPTDNKDLSVRVALCFMDNPPPDVDSVLRGLNFTRETHDQVMEALTFYRAALDGKPVTALPRLATPQTAAFLREAMLLERESNLKEWWGDYRKWAKCDPLVDGETLKKMGYPPGPIYKEILDAVARAKYEGKARKKTDEIQFILDNFRRE